MPEGPTRPRLYCSGKCRTRAWRTRVAVLGEIRRVRLRPSPLPFVPEHALDFEEEHRVA